MFGDYWKKQPTSQYGSGAGPIGVARTNSTDPNLSWGDRLKNARIEQDRMRAIADQVERKKNEEIERKKREYGSTAPRGAGMFAEKKAPAAKADDGSESGWLHALSDLFQQEPAEFAPAPVPMRRGRRGLLQNARPYDEPVAQAPNPYMVGASKRPKDRIRTDYTADHVAGGRGYVVVGDPGAELAVSGAKQVGPNMWRIAPGAKFSVESRTGKDGARGYYFKEAGLVG